MLEYNYLILALFYLKSIPLFILLLNVIETGKIILKLQMY